MLSFCACSIGRYNRDSLLRLARFFLQAIALLLATTGLTAIAIRFNIVHPIVGAILISALGTALTFAALLRSPLGSKVNFSWSALSTGDWISVTFFPLSVLIGWSDFWGDLPGNWAIAYTIISSILHTTAFWFLMLVVMRTARSFRVSFGKLGHGASPDDLTKRRTYAWHMRKCVSNKVAARHAMRMAPTAIRRRRQRNSQQRKSILAWADAVADSYEDSSSWMSAALASGGLFTWAVQTLPPGPVTALIFFIPFVLIPVVYLVRHRSLSDHA